jgi:hypothetical protein
MEVKVLPAAQSGFLPFLLTGKKKKVYTMKDWHE